MSDNIRTIGIIGLGLIGGSFADAFKEKGYLIYGLDKSADALSLSVDPSLFEGLTDSLDEFLDFPLDLIYICIPVFSAIKLIKELGKRGITTPITDASSTKASLQSAADEYNINYCGGHPIAGKETSGFIHADKNILKQSFHILTGKDNGLRKDIKDIHEMIGMRVIFMEANKHDMIFALNSHMPHLIAFTLVELLNNTDKKSLDFSGAGFKDFTRIAASNPAMWSDIFADNRANMLSLINDYIYLLENWKTLLEEENQDEIYDKISAISKIRRMLG